MVWLGQVRIPMRCVGRWSFSHRPLVVGLGQRLLAESRGTKHYYNCVRLEKGAPQCQGGGRDDRDGQSAQIPATPKERKCRAKCCPFETLVLHFVPDIAGRTFSFGRSASVSLFVRRARRRRFTFRTDVCFLPLAGHCPTRRVDRAWFSLPAQSARYFSGTRWRQTAPIRRGN
jgi:hypothetical protein